MITTIVFDLDDTLYDEIDYCKSGFASVAEFIINRAANLCFLTFHRNFAILTSKAPD